jgi:hypothetical protein
VTEPFLVEQGLQKAQTATAILYGTSFSNLKAETVYEALAGDERLVVVERETVLGTQFARLAASHGLAKSNCT